MSRQISRIILYLRTLGRIPFLRALVRLAHPKGKASLKTEVFGLEFANPVGLGNKIDRDCEIYNGLADYGFSFIEVGPLILNKSIRNAIRHIQNDRPDTILAANIARHPSHENVPDIVRDFLVGFSLLYDFVDMFVLNFTGGSVSTVKSVLDEILEARIPYDNYKPILVKLSHNIGDEEQKEILSYCMQYGVDGIVAGNIENVRRISTFTKGRFPIIGYGGIHSPEQAAAMLDAGASLIEITSGFVKNGTRLSKDIIKYLESTRK